MKVTLLVVGKTEEPYLQTGIEKYCDRLKHYVSFNMVTIPYLKNSKSLNIDQQKTAESDFILKQLTNSGVNVLLGDEGKALRSIEFAAYFEKAMINSISSITFIVGGAYGVDQRVREKCGMTLSLSKMTFSHQMIRLLFVEQLYRAMTILKKEPYHHE